MLHRNYDNSSAQEQTITSLVDYTKTKGITLNGFMPTTFRHNLDTIKILNDNNFSFMFSNAVNRPLQGVFDEGYRNPQMAYYNNNPTRVVKMPVSYPPVHL